MKEKNHISLNRRVSWELERCDRGFQDISYMYISASLPFC